jgi:hypothetical protein
VRDAASKRSGFSLGLWKPSRWSCGNEVGVVVEERGGGKRRWERVKESAKDDSSTAALCEKQKWGSCVFRKSQIFSGAKRRTAASERGVKGVMRQQ